MARIRVPLNNFERGEVSPSMTSRTDLNVYVQSAEKVRNFFLMAEGGVRRRPGTEFIYKWSSITATLETFTVTVTDYANIATGSTIKFYKQDGTLMTLEFEASSGSSPSSASGNTHYVRANESNDTTADNIYTAINAISGFTVPNPSANVVTVTRDAYGNDYQTVTSSDTTRLACIDFSGTPRLQIRIEPFSFSDDERYIVAFSAGQLDFFRIVASTGVISHIQTLTQDTDSATLPWTVDTIEATTFAQSADNMFVCHSSHKPMRIVRTALTTFEVRKFVFDTTTADDETYQPYFSFQASGVTLTPQATSGTGKTMTTSSAYWTSDHVGEIIRYAGNEVLITGYTSATVVTGTIRKTLSATTASANWDEQCFSDVRGFPSAVTFHEDRLWFAGTTDQPDGIWASTTSQYFNFDVDDASANDSIQFSLSAGEFNSIKHLTSSRDLQVFTSTSEFYIPSFADSALTPTNAQIRRQTPFGSSSVKPTPFDGATVYVQRGGKTIREFVYSDDEASYVSTPISLLSSHLVSKPTQMSAMRGALSRPESYSFFVNDDGTIAVFHSIRNEEKAGWTLWSTSDTSTTGRFHSICTVDERLFCVTARDLGGGTVRFMLEEFLDTATLDCSDDFSGASGVFTTNTIFENNCVLDVVSGNDYLGSFTQGSNQIDVSAVNTTSTSEIGFGFTGILTTLPIDAQVEGGPLSAEPRQITRVNLDLIDTLSVSVGSGGTAVPLILQSVTDDFSDGLSKFSGKKEFRMLGYGTDPRVYITQTAPVSLQLNGMIVEVAF